MKETFNILSLSGGGIKGLFQASFLKLLEKEYKVPLTDIFDLIAGTSTGSIVGAAVAKGINMSKVEGLYINKGEEIFDSNYGKYVRRSWYSNAKLKENLVSQFSTEQMTSINCEILIPTTSLENGKHKVFTKNDNLSIVDALMSSAAAPFYFKAYDVIEDSKHSYLDGGLWANNPTLLAILYAVTELDVPISRIRVLSLGTATKSEGMDAKNFNEIATCRPKKIKSVISAIFDASEDFSYFYAQKILSSNNIVYISPVDDVTKDIELDDVKKAIMNLPTLAENLFKANKETVMNMLGYEGRSRNTVKRSKFIKEEEIINVGLVDFVPSRDEYRKRDANNSLKEHLLKAQKSIRIISVSLADAIDYHGFTMTLGEIIKKRPNIKISISLLNPDNTSLLSVMAPILDLSPDELKAKIMRTIRRFGMSQDLSKVIELRVHDTIPTGTYIISDEETDDASVIVESRPFSSPSSCSFSYHIVRSDNPVLFDNILEGLSKMEKNVSRKLSKKDIKKWEK